MNTELDNFETRLLAELRSYIDEPRTTTDTDDNEKEGRQPRANRRWLAAATASIVMVLAAALLIPGIGSSPAYSVGEGNAGEINVKINRPEDAAGLQQALEQHGIAADITYLPSLQHCAPGRYTPVGRDVDMSSEVGQRSLSVTLASDTVRPGETFVLVWSILPMTKTEVEQVNVDPDTVGEVTEGFRSSIEFDVATGPVGTCDPVLPQKP